MSRCSCGNTTCSCVIKAAPDGGVKITGSGSPQSPYLVSMEAPLKDGITVADTQTLDLTVVPQAGGKVQIYGNTLTKVTDLKDVADVEGPQVGDSMVWMGTHWEFRPPTTVAPGVIHTDNGISGDGSLNTPIIAKTSGVFGTAPITTARYAGVQDFGDEIYLDTTGKLRTKPKMLWTNLNGSAAPSAYPNGWSILTVNSANVGGGTGWPGNFFGSVETVKRMETASAPDNGQVQQRFYKNNSVEVFYRWAANDAGSWSPWVQVVGPPLPDPVQTYVSASFALTSTTEVETVTPVRAAITNPNASKRMLVKVESSGTFEQSNTIGANHQMFGSLTVVSGSPTMVGTFANLWRLTVFANQLASASSYTWGYYWIPAAASATFGTTAWHTNASATNTIRAITAHVTPIRYE